MASQYDQLATTAMYIDTAAPPTYAYYAMSFPGRWKPALRRLAQMTTRRDVATIPISSLNETVTALVPDCVVTMTYAGRGDEDEEWLLAYQPVDPQAIFVLVSAWIRARNVAPEQIAAVLAELDPSHLSWTPVDADFGSTQEQRQAIRLLPMEAAAILSRPDLVCPYGDLTFRRCAADAGAELISWPPFRVEERTPYSVLITLTAQTLPTSDEINVHLGFGVRRWMPIASSLAFDHGHSVYLATAVPYLSGAVNSRHFSRARIRRTRAIHDGETVYRPQWDDDLAAVLGEAGCLARLPDPIQLAAEPTGHLRADGDIAALVYRTGMLKKERVSAGLSALDREALMTWATEVLEPRLRPVDPLPRVRTRIYTGLAAARDLAAEARVLPAAIHAVVGPRLDVELHTDTTATTILALNALTARFGAKMPDCADLGDDPHLVEAGNLVVAVRRPSAGIAERLDRGENKHRVPVATAVQTRIDRIVDALPPAVEPTVALVEIGHPNSYQGSQRGEDPKFAVRHGLARTGRLSQFVTPIIEPSRAPRQREGRPASDPDAQRFGSSVDELFRQLGVRPEDLPEPVPNTLSCRPALLAIWLIRKNKGRPWGIRRSIPIALLIDPTGHHVQVHAPGIDWQPLHTGLLEFGSRFLDVTSNPTKDEITRFIRTTLDVVPGTHSDTLLVTHAQNLRNGWPSLTNSNTVLDAFTFGAEQRKIESYPGLRHVRVRTALDNETPQCFGPAETKPGLPQGLWRYRHPRLYGSTGAKPSSAASAIIGASKIVATEYRDKLQAPRPNSQVWNQQFIELFVAGLQPDDDPDHWAALTHDLRWAAPYSKVTTTMPWPLHLAEQVEEYLLPLKITETGSSSDDPSNLSTDA